MKNDQSALADRLEALCGVQARDCYQCGKCTAGCPMASEMDFPPSLIMRLLQTGTDSAYRKVLSSRAIWYCVGCEQCIGRCPKEVDIPVLMDCLRGEAQKEGCISPEASDIIKFHKSFLGSVHRNGRLGELDLVVEYKLRSLHLLQDVTVAPGMLAKGKLSLLPPHIKGKKAVQEIFARTKEESAKAE
ncbi:MAG: 4Fe-4S dicluster domain-containing protein [Bacteroidaceae bacterium]|jgi:heterodisulfide reductase subunit C